MEQFDQPNKIPEFQIGDIVMGFAIHYPVAGKIKDMKWNLVNLEWDYFIENEDGFDGKIKETRLLKFDQNIWDDVESKWKKYLEIMKDAAILESECKKLLKKN